MSDIDLKALREDVDAHATHPKKMIFFQPERIRALIDRLESAERRAEEAEKECAEQARLVGMGAERELALMAKLGKAEKERDALRGMFSAAVADIAQVSAAVGVPEEDAACANGNEEILACVEGLKLDAKRYAAIKRMLPDLLAVAAQGGVNTDEAPEIFAKHIDSSKLDAGVDAWMAQEGGK